MKICYDTMSQKSHVIVLGAGPSLKENFPAIKEWKDKHDALVISANYKHDIKIDYTLFMDKNVFSERVFDAEGLIVITNRLFKLYRKLTSDKRIKNRIRILQTIGQEDYEPFKHTFIRIQDNGLMNYFPPNAGYAALLLASFCRPEHVLIAGFDGRSVGGTNDHKLLYKDGKITRIRISQKKRWVNKDQKYQLRKVILPFMKKNKIAIHAFSNDKLRGILSKNNINIIKSTTQGLKTKGGIDV